MTDPAILGALAFLLGLMVLVLLCGAIVAGLRERAYQRAKEAEYATAYRDAHKRNQDKGRYDHDVPGRPE